MRALKYHSTLIFSLIAESKVIAKGDTPQYYCRRLFVTKMLGFFAQLVLAKGAASGDWG